MIKFIAVIAIIDAFCIVYCRFNKKVYDLRRELFQTLPILLVLPSFTSCAMCGIKYLPIILCAAVFGVISLYIIATLDEQLDEQFNNTTDIKLPNAEPVLKALKSEDGWYSLSAIKALEKEDDYYA